MTLYSIVYHTVLHSGFVAGSPCLAFPSSASLKFCSWGILAHRHHWFVARLCSCFHNMTCSLIRATRSDGCAMSELSMAVPGIGFHFAFQFLPVELEWSQLRSFCEKWNGDERDAYCCILVQSLLTIKGLDTAYHTTFVTFQCPEATIFHPCAQNFPRTLFKWCYVGWDSPCVDRRHADALPCLCDAGMSKQVVRNV